MLPIITTPRIMSGLTRSRDCVETPSFFTGIRIVRDNKTTNTELTTPNTDHDFVLHYKRRHCDRIAEVLIPYLDIPEWLSIRCIKRDEVGVQCSHEHLVIKHGHPTVVRATADPCILGWCVPIKPEDPPGNCIHRHDIIRSLGDIHNPVDNDRVRLPGTKHLILEHPF